MNFYLRGSLVLVLVAAVLLLTRHETWALRVILLVPLLRLGGIWPGAGRGKAALPVMVLIAVVASWVLHSSAARTLGGFVRWEEIVWSAWFYLACLLVLEALDLGLARAARSVKRPWLRSSLRLVVILLLVPPLALACLQVVQVKTGYPDQPLQAAGLDRPPEQFTCTSDDGVRIRGYFFDRGTDTTLVLAHGLAAHTHNFLPYLEALLVDRRLNGLILDFRGHGYSQGHTTSFGVHEQMDLEAALDWLKTHRPRAAERIVFYGFSMGGAAVAEVAGRTPQTVAVILDSTFDRVTDVAAAMTDRLPPVFGPYVYHTALPAASLLAGAPLWRFEPGVAADRIVAPLSRLHGGADRMIPVAAARRPGGRGGMTVVPGGKHTGLPGADRHYFRRLGRFIDLALTEGQKSPPRRPGFDSR